MRLALIVLLWVRVASSQTLSPVDAANLKAELLVTVDKYVLPAVPPAPPVVGGVLVSVKDYGAIGDGIANDTTSLQAAITAMPAGGALYVPGGTYNFTTLTIAGKASSTIWGTGAVLKCIATAEGPLVTVTTSTGLTIRDLIFDFNYKPGYGLDITSGQVRLIGNTFKNLGDGASNGMQAAVLLSPGSDDVLIGSNSFVNLRSSVTAAVRGVYVTNFRNPASASVRTRIIGNRFDTLLPNHDADCVVIAQETFSSFALVSGNLFYNCSKRAVKLQSNENVVSGNTILLNNVGAQALAAVSSLGSKNRIVDNTVKAYGCNSGCSHASGVEIGGSQVYVINNSFENPSTTTDTAYGVRVDIGNSTNGEAVFDGIEVRGNSFRKVYMGLLVGTTVTPVTNMRVQDNTVISSGYSSFVFWTNANVNGLVFTGNVRDSPSSSILEFVTAGTANKLNLGVKNNIGGININGGVNIF